MFTRRALLIGLCALTMLGSGLAFAANFGPRQYYSGWQKHPNFRYHFRKYFFKPTPQFSGFRHHFVIHHPQRPKHLYFYNPYKKQFWGRCEAQRNGAAKYSLLAVKDRKGSLKEIPETAFPEPGPLPPMPESEDGTLLDLPPDDLPDLDNAAAAAPKDE
jgi:hypothetical protein